MAKRESGVREPELHLIRVYESDRTYVMHSSYQLKETDASVDWGRSFAAIPAELRTSDGRRDRDAEAMLRKLLASDDPRDERIVHLLDLVATRAFAIGREYDGFEKHVIGQFAGLMAKRDDERRKRRP